MLQSPADQCPYPKFAPDLNELSSTTAAMAAFAPCKPGQFYLLLIASIPSNVRSIFIKCFNRRLFYHLHKGVLYHQLDLFIETNIKSYGRPFNVYTWKIRSCSLSSVYFPLFLQLMKDYVFPLPIDNFCILCFLVLLVT